MKLPSFQQFLGVEKKKLPRTGTASWIITQIQVTSHSFQFLSSENFFQKPPSAVRMKSGILGQFCKSSARTLKLKRCRSPSLSQLHKSPSLKLISVKSLFILLSEYKTFFPGWAQFSQKIGISPEEGLVMTGEFSFFLNLFKLKSLLLKSFFSEKLAAVSKRDPADDIRTSRMKTLKVQHHLKNVKLEEVHRLQQGRFC